MSVPVQVDQQIEIQIDRLSYDGGRGVGRYQGFVVFVPYTAPNESVLARITSIHKSFATAELLQILKKSPDRRDARCPVFGKCGGCAWQHVNYSAQLEQKRLFVLRSLEKFIQKDNGQKIIDAFQVIPSPNEFHYRNRIQIRTLGDQTGFLRAASNELVPIQDCCIAERALMAAIPELPRKPNEQIKIEVQSHLDNSVTVRRLDEEESVFTQVNTLQNVKLQSCVVDFIKDAKPLHVWDLYCGDGNLTFPLIQALPDTQFTAVEYSNEAIQRAKNKSQKFKNIQFFSDDTFTYLRKLKSLPKQSALVVDPPRAGLTDKTCREIVRLQPECLVYVSCNLSTLARDLNILHKNYRITALKALDMFPQTEWIETVVMMAPRGNDHFA